MSRTTAAAVAGSLCAAGVAGAIVPAFTLAGPLTHQDSTPRKVLGASGAQQAESTDQWHPDTLSLSLVAVGAGLALRRVAARGSSVRSRATAVALHAVAKDEQSESVAKQAASVAASAVLLAGPLAESATAYPIFAQQNYANPRESTGKIVCANCHLASKYIDVRMPQQVLPDTIFKAIVDIPAKYQKRKQPIASGEKGPLNVGAVCIMPDGFRLAPKNRLPKPLKKEMKGLAWAQYSKEKPNIVVAGPVPGERYEKMVLPILAPDPNTNKDVHFDRVTFFYGGNRGRGQIYPEGNLSNNNQFFANATGTITAIDGLKVTITADDGKTSVVECLPGADIVYAVGEKVTNGDPITTNPNVGGFGQDERELTLQDINRVYAYCALGTSIFFAQLAFVLKKKQFEKVQLAEGF